jgi:uncharacterized protein
VAAVSRIAIPPDERMLATLTHLSGLAGYVIPFGGVLVPILIWVTKKDAPIIAAIARQAILLNVIVFSLIFLSAILWLTIILIPFMSAFATLLGLVVVALPIIGAVQASNGVYYRYPIVGSNP